MVSFIHLDTSLHMPYYSHKGNEILWETLIKNWMFPLVATERDPCLKDFLNGLTF